jgi:hypothetical protein
MAAAATPVRAKRPAIIEQVFKASPTYDVQRAL